MEGFLMRKKSLLLNVGTTIGMVREFRSYFSGFTAVVPVVELVTEYLFWMVTIPTQKLSVPQNGYPT
jgi:hypothetical protein